MCDCVLEADKDTSAAVERVQYQWLDHRTRGKALAAALGNQRAWYAGRSETHAEGAKQRAKADGGGGLCVSDRTQSKGEKKAGIRKRTGALLHAKAAQQHSTAGRFYGFD